MKIGFDLINKPYHLRKPRRVQREKICNEDCTSSKMTGTSQTNWEMKPSNIHLV